MEIIVRMTDVCKEYGSVSVLNHVNMQLKQGDIYGFVGANGAGKTTTIRVLTGLAKATCGDVQLFGYSGKKNLQRKRSRIGCIIEKPALYGFLNVEQNLEIQRIQRGIPGKECVAHILRMVGLDDDAKKKVLNLSVGMQQRLAIGIALLGEPELLVLDEPTNGLDPKAIIEIRNMLRKINQEKEVTMLISSHILSELHQLASCYGFLSKGTIVEQITVAQLKERCRKYICAEVMEMEKAINIIENCLGITDYEVITDREVHIQGYKEGPEDISKAFLENGVNIKSFSLKGENLEEYFTKLVGGRRDGKSD